MYFLNVKIETYFYLLYSKKAFEKPNGVIDLNSFVRSDFPPRRIIQFPSGLTGNTLLSGLLNTPQIPVRFV